MSHPRYVSSRSRSTGMTRNTAFRRLCFMLPLFSTIAMPQPPDRLRARIEGRGSVALRGTRNPRIAFAEDEGALADNFCIHGIQLQFKPSAAQSAALEQLLDDQQNPASPRYHAWLTPEEFGSRFGLSVSDFDEVKGWLERQGFQIDAIARSRTSITFSGPVRQLRDTLQTDIHSYRARGR